MGKVDPRLMIALGFVGFAVGTWQASFITADWDFWELLVPQMFRGFSLMLCMVPINNLVARHDAAATIKNASGLFNLTRNLGGAFGLALINTTARQAHGPASRAPARIGGLGPLGGRRDAGRDRPRRSPRAAPTPRSRRRAKLALMVRRQAEVMALADVFLALTVIFLALSRPGGADAPAAADGGGRSGGH